MTFFSATGEEDIREEGDSVSIAMLSQRCIKSIYRAKPKLICHLFPWHQGDIFVMKSTFPINEVSTDRTVSRAGSTCHFSADDVQQQMGAVSVAWSVGSTMMTFSPKTFSLETLGLLCE